LFKNILIEPEGVFLFLFLLFSFSVTLVTFYLFLGGSVFDITCLRNTTLHDTEPFSFLFSLFSFLGGTLLRIGKKWEWG